MDRFVIGGGPSLSGFDFNRLRGQSVIAVNAAYVDVPWAEYLFFSDARFHEWQQDRPEWHAFAGIKATTWRHARPPVQRFEPAPHGVKLSLRTHQLAGSNSGEKALNLAWLLGATRIFLLGFDMKSNGNYHDRHVLKNRQGHYDSKFVPSLTAMGRELNVRGARVFNACPDSELTVFPRIPLDGLPI